MAQDYCNEQLTTLHTMQEVLIFHNSILHHGAKTSEQLHSGSSAVILQVYT